MGNDNSVDTQNDKEQCSKSADAVITADNEQQVETQPIRMHIPASQRPPEFVFWMG